jgi:hypothetical protein
MHCHLEGRHYPRGCCHHCCPSLWKEGKKVRGVDGITGDLGRWSVLIGRVVVLPVRVRGPPGRAICMLDSDEHCPPRRCEDVVPLPPPREGRARGQMVSKRCVQITLMCDYTPLWLVHFALRCGRVRLPSEAKGPPGCRLPVLAVEKACRVGGEGG